MKYQKILVMSTSRNSIRSEAEGWTFEDSSNIQPNQKEYSHIGTSSIDKSKIFGEFHCFDCPLRAMANGFRLMAPPEKCEWTNSDGKTITEFVWWFEKLTD